MRMQAIIVDKEEFYFGLSFDIDNFIGDGVWWLQVYDRNKNPVYDRPFASSRGEMDKKRIENIIRDEVLYRGCLL